MDEIQNVSLRRVGLALAVSLELLKFWKYRQLNKQKCVNNVTSALR